MVFYLSLHVFSGGIEERKTFNELGSQHVSMSKVQLSQRVDEWVGGGGGGLLFVPFRV